MILNYPKKDYPILDNLRILSTFALKVSMI